MSTPTKEKVCKWSFVTDRWQTGCGKTYAYIDAWERCPLCGATLERKKS